MVSMNMAARNHCSRPMARALHGHNVCAEISPKPLQGLNFQIEDSEKFGLNQLKKLQNAPYVRGSLSADGIRLFSAPLSGSGGVNKLRLLFIHLNHKHRCEPTARRSEIRCLPLIEAGCREQKLPVVDIEPD